MVEGSSEDAVQEVKKSRIRVRICNLILCYYFLVVLMYYKLYSVYCVEQELEKKLLESQQLLNSEMVCLEF